VSDSAATIMSREMTMGGVVPGSWSRAEVEAAVSDYFDMLVHELREQAFNKTKHRRQLMGRLDARSEGSIERKHQNISAVLIRLGYPFIQGYKPAFNHQRLLAEVVAERLGSAEGLTQVVRISAEMPARRTSIKDYLVRLEDPPDTANPAHETAREVDDIFSRARPPVNYLEREARNASLGRAGEEFVVDFERARLAQSGADRLVDRVEHVAVTKGDGLGFDVRSFNEDGSDRFIEVKTTAYGKQTPFFVSRNELFVSRANAREYHLYRVFGFRVDPRLYELKGSLSETCVLEPVQYSARAG